MGMLNRVCVNVCLSERECNSSSSVSVNVCRLVQHAGVVE